MNRTVVIFTIVLSTVLSSCHSPRPFEEVDRKDIVNLALRTALVDKKIPDYHLLKDTSHIILSTVNLKQEWIEEIPNVQLILLTPDSIQTLANATDDFLYLQFGEFKFTDNGDVELSLANVWAVNQHTKGNRKHLSGGGFRFSYYRKGDRWYARPRGVFWIS